MTSGRQNPAKNTHCLVAIEAQYNARQEIATLSQDSRRNNWRLIRLANKSKSNLDTCIYIHLRLDEVFLADVPCNQLT